MKDTERYENCISLGWFCGTASSLSKLGLRSFSGPFDWCYSDFDSVINQMDNEFKDFMKKENLEIVDNKPGGFKDKKYNFHYLHDMKKNFESEYADIYDKYSRRIRRFIEKIKSPTCFFRAVSSEKEVEYIVNHTDYIESVLKRYHSKNRIVYILLNHMRPLPDKFSYFQVSSYSGRFFEMREMFEQSEELLQFCKTLLKTEQVDLNKKYDIRGAKRAIAGALNWDIHDDIDGIDMRISNMLNLQDNEPFYIWGGGDVASLCITI